MSFTPERPQYLFVNIAPNRPWNQNRPETVNDALFDTPLNAIALRADSTKRRRLGLSFVFSYLNGPPEAMDATLRRLLSLAERREVPILIVLEGRDWWNHRADLWNWWDSGRSGFDPKNRENVEWTGWGPENAVKICWRNWGSQIRVRPAANLAAPRFREANRRELFRMAGIIREWRDRLPVEKRWLCPGVKIGSETSIGINAYHYPNGNSYLEQWPNDPSHDPKTGMDMKKDFAGGLVPLGYAGLMTKGWKRGGEVTLADQERLTADYIGFIADICHDAGFPKDETFVHAGGQYAPWKLHYTHRTALTPDATPGWSLYNTLPTDAGDLPSAVAASPNREWCAAEWLTFAPTAAGWQAAIEGTLNFERCRFLSLYNADILYKKPYALEGLKRALAEHPSAN